MKTPKHSGKTSEKKTTSGKPAGKSPVKKPNNIMEDDDDFEVPLDDIGGLDDFNSFEDEDDY